MIATAVGTAVGAVSTVAGTIGGLVIGVTSGKAKDVGATLKKVMAEQDLQKNVQEQVAKRLNGRNGSEFTLQEKPFAGSTSGLAGSGSSGGGGFGKLLEIQITEASVVALVAPHSPLMMIVRMRVRLLQARDGRVLYQDSLEYRGRTRRLADWSEKGGQHFRVELDRCTEALVEKVVKDVFGRP